MYSRTYISAMDYNPESVRLNTQILPGTGTAAAFFENCAFVAESGSPCNMRQEVRMARPRATTIDVFLAQDHEVVRKLCPDVVITDIDMPGLSGLDATRRIVQASPEVSVLILTVYTREDLLSRSLQAGARGHVPKAASVDDLLTAIRTVHAGQVFIYPSMTTKLVDGYLRRMRGE
jgi:DNA-binding NarL/FixJ family response regulator